MYPIATTDAVSEETEIKGFVGPVLIDSGRFNRVTSPLVYDRMTTDKNDLATNYIVIYDGVLGGKLVYIENCKCIETPKIIDDKLVLTHSYGGGPSNRESTKLLWNGKYYQNSQGQYIIDVILYSDVGDNHKAMLIEKKIHDVTPLRREGEHFVWINLVGYQTLIGYAY